MPIARSVFASATAPAKVNGVAFSFQNHGKDLADFDFVVVDEDLFLQTFG
jgi:hypothetical protein